MLRHLTFIACLTLAGTAAAIGPADFAATSSTANDATNAGFLAAASHFSGAYAPSAASAGPSYSNAPGISGLAGYSATLWFVSQDASYHNGFGVTADGVSTLAFADSRTAHAGDHVQVSAGGVDKLDFFALINIRKGAAATVFHDGSAPNGDHLSHITMTTSPLSANGSLWLSIALEDMWGGGQRDWNDLAVLLQLTPVAAPEPATVAMLAGFGAVALWLARRQRAAVA